LCHDELEDHLEPDLGARLNSAVDGGPPVPANLRHLMGSLIKKRRKRMRKKKHKKMLKRTRWQRRAAGK
jgi:siroheme synthase (precorrin-2 oxidase/ferrochelatase)